MARDRPERYQIQGEAGPRILKGDVDAICGAKIFQAFIAYRLPRAQDRFTVPVT